MKRLGDMTTEQVSALLAADSPVVALLATGSVEPHGPHLPLSTDTIISEAACADAAARLADKEIVSVLVPPIHYGVTDCAAGFHGAVTIQPATLTQLLTDVAQALLADGFAHVCLVNNHLEPAHYQAVMAAADDRVSVACPLARRWGRTLTDEFKRGECHAGQYETSIVLAAAPDLVGAIANIPEVKVSLSEGLAAGQSTFQEMGLNRAYAGAPAAATAEEGQRTIAQLGAMVATTVLEGLDA